jgi:hypothetical protein
MDTPFRFLVGILVVLSSVLLLFLCGLVVELRGDVEGLQEVLASKQDLLSIGGAKIRWFHEEKCTTCHSERRFAGAHNTRGEMEAALAHMRSMPDTRFSDDDMAKIHASLTLLRCRTCHGEEKLRILALKSPEERMEIIRRMIAKPGSNLSPDEAVAIDRGYQLLLE